MNLTAMRFKDYVWPHNPRVYEMEYRRSLVCHKVPFGLYSLQNTGRTMRIMRGDGEFSGEGAYAQFKKLATVFYGEGPGTLVHPLWDTTRAYFVSLELLQEPTEDYVRYAFEFWEDYEGHSTALTLLSPGQEQPGQEPQPEQEHRVEPGENIFTIAAELGISVEELMELNPEIKNPVILPAGISVIMHE